MKLLIHYLLLISIKNSCKSNSFLRNNQEKIVFKHCIIPKFDFFMEILLFGKNYFSCFLLFILTKITIFAE